MPKVPITSRMDPEIVARLERVGKVDRRTLSQLVEICVEEMLPELEQRISTLKDSSAPYKSRTRTASSKHAKKVA